MPHLSRALLVAAVIALAFAPPAIAQTWTVQAVDLEREEVKSPAFCILRSSEGLMISHSPYQNTNYVGFTGSNADALGLRWLPHGPIQRMKTLLQVDDGYKVLLESTLHRVPRPESGGVLIDLYAYYSTGSELIAALRGGSKVYIRVAEDLSASSSVNHSSATPLVYSLKGSAVAIAKLARCVAGEPFLSTFGGEAFGAAIDTEIET